MSLNIPRQLERLHFPAGTKIFREGEPGSCAYLIEKGKVEISAVNLGRKIAISTLEAGELFGEMALIDNLKRSATATVIEDAVVIALDRSQFENKITTADPVLHMLLRVVLKRFRWALRKALSKERMHMTGEMGPSGQTMIFDSARNEAIRQIQMEHALNEALTNGQFELHYQPIVATDDLRIAGFEALIRWNHPQRGLLSPAEFISAAEDSKLIVPIGEWALRQACADLARLQRAQAPVGRRLYMTVNVSSRQIHHLAQKDLLADLVQDAGVDAGDVKLEFTESVLIESPELAAQALGDIKKVGVNFAIDDFGTGYSSLSYLQRFPLDVLKIDRSFVTDMATDPGSLQIVSAILGLSRALSMQVVAEGIESPDSLRLLREMQCEFVQGYLLAKPGNVDQSLDLIHAHTDFSRLLEDVPAVAANA